jgi:hypothetical protein
MLLYHEKQVGPVRRAPRHRRACVSHAHHAQLPSPSPHHTARRQVAALCGVHCINTLLQGPIFSEVDLAHIGHELDQLERAVLGDAGAAAAAGTSTNLDESGMFSVQVRAKGPGGGGCPLPPAPTASAATLSTPYNTTTPPHASNARC